MEELYKATFMFKGGSNSLKGPLHGRIIYKAMHLHKSRGIRGA